MTARPPKKSISAADFIRGTIVGHEFVRKNVPFLLFLTGLGLLAITCSHQADRKIGEIQTKSAQLNRLESHYLETKAELMQWGRESRIQERALERGLVPSGKPPIKLEVQPAE
jgi:cell division protein FtsL